MANKIYDVRILLRNATDSEWEAVKSSFVPMKGEVVLYDAGQYKIGNGTDVLDSLPFYYGDKDTDTKYAFSVAPAKPGVITVTPTDKNGTAGTPVDVTIPGMAKASDLEALEDRVDALTSAMDFKGQYDSLDDANAAITAPENGDFILVGSKEYVWYKGSEEGATGSWHEVGDESALSNYVLKEDGKGLSTKDFTQELYDKLNGISESADAVSLDDSVLLTKGTTVAKITINGTEYTIKAPTAGESKTYYLSNLEATAPDDFTGEVVMDGGSVPA